MGRIETDHQRNVTADKLVSLAMGHRTDCQAASEQDEDNPHGPLIRKGVRSMMRQLLDELDDYDQ